MFSATVPAVTVINTESVSYQVRHNSGREKSQILVIKRLRVLGSGTHRPAGFFWEYPLGILPAILYVIFRLVDFDYPSS